MKLKSQSPLYACGYENIPKENNPHHLQWQMGDKAEYWVNGVGELLHMKFVARLNYHGQFSQLGPYFNLFDSGIDLSNLKQTWAQFELHFLAPEDEDSADYPQEALDMSCRVLNTLSALTMAIEDRRNASILEADRPAVSPFSELLFKDLPKEGSTTTPRISRRDIGKLGVLLSPSLSALKEMKVECPDVRDRNGLLIHPREYSMKLSNGHFVEVEVYLKLWNIGKSKKDDVTEHERLGSRNYQLIMRRMQLLPSMGYAKADILKGKRKAREDLDGTLQAKRPFVASSQDNSMEVI
ncbi:hypothetical protein F4604DRAFT_1673776 [Suillus subluteus]|nr:hypothetical protein F4604DRAFT_1673776 [Suillus subluteus]